MRRALVVLFTVSALANAAEPMTLKGLAPGMSKAEIEAVHPGFTHFCVNTDKIRAGGESCGYPSPGGPKIPALDSFSGVEVQRWLASFRDGLAHTISITMKNEQFDRVRAAMAERWGKPSASETGTVQNRLGASFDQERVEWRGGGRVLLLRKRTSNLDTMAIYLGDEAFISQMGKERREVQPKTDAQDM